MIYELRLDTNRIFMTFYNTRINILSQGITSENINNKKYEQNCFL